MSRAPKPVKLERRLTKRMIQVQAIALIFFFGVIVFPLGVYPALTYLGQAQPLDPHNAVTFAEALRLEDDGTARVEMTPSLANIVREHPSVWFYASTEAGLAASLGEMPDYYHQVRDSMWWFEGVDVRPLPESSISGLQLNKHRSELGEVMIAAGNGPTIGAATVIRAFWAVLSVSTFVVLAIAAAVIIPRVIRRELRGIEQAAEQARLINIDARGTRLPTGNVPQEVRALVDAVNDGLARLDDSYARRERFLADSAHELRTPIAILQTRLETASPFPEQQRLLLDVARLSSLADQLLDLQRMDLGETEMSPLDLVELAETVVGDLAPLAINAGYEIALDAPDAPVMVNGDAGSLMRALANVVQNAIVHGSNQGQINVAVSPQGTLSVADQGPGIEPVDRERVFEPFYRVKPLAKGAGLGLNLVASIIQRHHGRVAITEAPAGGACLVMTLPLLPAITKAASTAQLAR